MKLQDVVLIGTTLISGLTAGLFFAYSCSVSPGLGKLSDENYLNAMQSINREIQNPLFLGCFIGLIFLLPISAFLQFQNKYAFILMIIAAIIYLTGVFGITAAGNIPLNEKLDEFTIQTASKNELRAMRTIFEHKWNYFNNCRTISAIVSFLIAVYACFLRK